ncbi:sulfurtransferase [Burkholderia contaminans]|uniref:sulfurtransferase n=1 Tax=Burkholderia TaxID=32008 RepID=UPI00064B35B5|nr:MULTISPECIES: sulfurtransferase [Burkholderia]AKM45251.1 thiosulfate sulfurtransferase [Burkholderia contaminans]AOL08540.1 thiosulfate sulfurtransferase [Burkholderia contaminans]ELK6462095.1 sulfurtransferase [Burkholderia contaminans]MCA7887860.1 sulfurtransferase [Burkholderia contaminans]RQT07918.1 sulfurtransferase [Burkholderia contaminans]
MHERVLISATDLAELMKMMPAVLIDTRDAANYAEAHLPGAVNIHEIFTYLAMSTPQGIAALRETFADAFGKVGLSGHETAVVYEQSMTTGFGQSCRGYVLLRYLGYPKDKIKVLHGGFSAWRATGLPSTTDVPAPTPVRFPVGAEGAGILVDLNEMKVAVADPHVVKLDVRDVDEWIGESSSPYGKDFCPRKGRIPGSVWLEWYRMLKPTPAGQMFKSPAEILAECATVGIQQDTPVVVFCFKGARASTTFVALEEAGIRNVRLYLGSWNEWSRDFSLPIEEGVPY